MSRCRHLPEKEKSQHSIWMRFLIKIVLSSYSEMNSWIKYNVDRRRIWTRDPRVPLVCRAVTSLTFDRLYYRNRNTCLLFMRLLTLLARANSITRAGLTTLIPRAGQITLIPRVRTNSSCSKYRTSNSYSEGWINSSYSKYRTNKSYSESWTNSSCFKYRTKITLIPRAGQITLIPRAGQITLISRAGQITLISRAGQITLISRDGQIIQGQEN